MQYKSDVSIICKRAYVFFEEQRRDLPLLAAYFGLPALGILQTVLGGLAMLVAAVLHTIAFQQLHGSEIAHD